MQTPTVQEAIVADGENMPTPNDDAKEVNSEPTQRPSNPISRRATLGLLGVGGLGLLGDQASAQQRSRPWQTDVDAGGHTLSNLGALEMAANEETITDFEGPNLTIDGTILTSKNTQTNVSDGGTQVVADATDINFGSNLDVSDDENGSVTVSVSGGHSHTYKTHSIDSEGGAWEALTGLSGETPVEVTIDTYHLSSGRISVETDETLEAEIGRHGTLQRIVAPTESVTLRSTGEFTFLKFQDIRIETEQPGLAFKSDGTKLYICGGELGGLVHSFNLSTPWDMTSTSGSEDGTAGIFEVEIPTSITFKADGTRMYVTGFVGVASYDLSTPWDITTASHGTTFDTSSQDSNPTGIAFKDDGSVMYVTGNDTKDIYSYDLLTPLDPSTASVNSTLDVFEQESEPGGIAFNAAGTKLFLSGGSSEKYIGTFSSHRGTSLPRSSTTRLKPWVRSKILRISH